jgi:hypothetical protein
MKRFIRWRRVAPARQRRFDFFERSLRRQRWFKRGILAITCLVVVGIFVFVPRGRYVVASLAAQARQAARQGLGLPTPREEVDAGWERFRQQGIADSQRALVDMYNGAEPSYQRLLRYAGLDPEHGLLRWGNFDRTLLISGYVFEADESGRSYRFRPCTESIWLRNVTIKSGVLMLLQVPDRPDLPQAVYGTSAIPVEASRQTTNTWGLRGPDPDPTAPLRGIVLGDSFMQGMFIGDDQTPPECLRRYLEGQLKTKVSILNTGHLGYSPEQYYYSLLAYAERFRPDFVVVSMCPNDFGDLWEVIKGRGDWEEGKYWLDKITAFCRTRNWPHLFVPVPFEPHMLGRRRAGFYPGTISNILETNSLMMLDPTDDFINAHLALVVAGERAGKRPMGCPLFNVEIGDGHFSALGSEVWAAAVGRRLVLLLERNRELAPKGPPAKALSPPNSAPNGISAALRVDPGDLSEKSKEAPPGELLWAR